MPPYEVQRGYVTAETRIGPGRASVDFPAGARLPEDIPAEELATLARSGAVVWVDGSSAVESAPVDPSKRPAKSAPRAPWVAWAVHVHGLTDGAVGAMTVADLQALPDAPEADGEGDEDQADGSEGDDEGDLDGSEGDGGE
ncbi:hypothetical protein [Glycomyces arizonensis]|uniref:hypothetical protein n=1 Tax=Glycomyces arizonensis TaxID=256035 RepID=UPI000425C4EF|nr:hypothetical protein [Glycomyces arizonensis]